MLRQAHSRRLYAPVLQAIRLQRRCESTRTPWRKDSTSEPSVFVEENFAKHTLFVLDVAKRVFKFSLIGVLALGATAATVYEGMHLWVENVELAPEADENVRKWEWDMETEKWTGNPTGGGTDHGLGFKARHIVRAAWMAQNWGVGYSTAVLGSDTPVGEGLVGPGGLTVIDARLQRSEDFLRTAIAVATDNASAGKLHPQTILELQSRHAAILERLGSDFLQESRTQYEYVWAGSPKDVRAARIALKLGDICSRQGKKDDALTWWSRAIKLAQLDTSKSAESAPPTTPVSAPSSPFAQRTLSSAFVSLSAFYAMSGQLNKAQALQEASLNLLRSIRPSETLASAPPPQVLHSLYLLQRSSLLSIHLAEVHYAQRHPVATSLQWLTSAAESSQRVAHALTGVTSSQPDYTQKPSVPSTEKLLSIYTSSRCVQKAASSLLRDARRTAAEAWNLMGILNEAREGSSSKIALECYEQAVNWAGTPPDKQGARKASESTLESDWNIYWGNYSRLQRGLENKI